MRIARAAALVAMVLAVACAASACAGPPTPVASATAFEVRARRIVSIPPNLTYSYATVDDSVAHLAGVRADVPGRIERLLLGRVFPGIANVARVGGVEDILRREPDAVFDWVYVEREVDLMRAVGLPGITFANSEAAFADWPQVEGRIAGKSSRAAALRRSYDARADALVRARGERPLDRMTRVLLISSIEPQIIGVAIPHAFALAGVRSTLSRRSVIGLEAIAAMDPDIVLLIGDNVAPAELYSSPRWDIVPAVRARRVYEIPEEWPGFNGIVDEPFFARWLAELAYPDKMPRSLRAEMQQTYVAEFRYRVDDAQLDRALRLRNNAGSAGYVRRFGRST